MTKQKKQMFLLVGGTLFLAVYWTLPLLKKNKGEEPTATGSTAPAEAGPPEESPAQPPNGSPEPAPSPSPTAGLLTAPPAVAPELKTARPPGYSPFEPLIKPTSGTKVSPGNEGQAEGPGKPPPPPSASAGATGTASLPPAPVVPPVWAATPRATPAAPTPTPSSAKLSQAPKAKGQGSGPAPAASGSQPVKPSSPDAVPPVDTKPPPAAAEATVETESPSAASGPPANDSGFVSPPGLPVPYQLVGILQGPPRLAILRNGDQRYYVRERETLANQFLIERIRDHQVWLRMGSQRIRLEMGEQAHEQG